MRKHWREIALVLAGAFILFLLLGPFLFYRQHPFRPYLKLNAQGLPVISQGCPAGTSPLSWGVTRDPVTDSIKQNFCIDARGNIFYAGALSDAGKTSPASFQGSDDVDRINRAMGYLAVISSPGSLITTTLTADMASGATSITVAACANFQNGNFIVIGSEVLLLQDGARSSCSTTWTVLPGQLGTSQSFHANGSTVSIPLGGVIDATAMSGQRTGAGPIYWLENVESHFGGVQFTVTLPAGGYPMGILGSNAAVIGLGSGFLPQAQTVFKTTTTDAFGFCAAGSNGVGGTVAGQGLGCVRSRDAGPANNDPATQSIYMAFIDLRGPGSASTNPGLVLTGMSNSEFRNNSFEGWAIGMDSGDRGNDGANAVNTLYVNLFGNRITLNNNQKGIVLNRVSNAIRGFGNRVGGTQTGTTGIWVGTSTDAYTPNEINLYGTTLETLAVGVQIEANQGGFKYDGGRMEAVVTGVAANTNCKLRNVVFDSVQFSGSDTNITTSICPGIIFRNVMFAEMSTGYGQAVNPGPNLITNPGFEGRAGTVIYGWGSIGNATPSTWPSGAALAVNTAAPQFIGTGGGNLGTANAKVGDGGALSGAFTMEDFMLDPLMTYTLSFWATADVNGTTFRPCFRFKKQSDGSLLGAEFGATVYGSGAWPKPFASELTGDLQYNRTGYATLNAHCMGGDLTVATANTWQHWTVAVRSPYTTAVSRAQLAFVVNNANHIFLDEVAFSLGYAPASVWTTPSLNPYGTFLAPAFGLSGKCITNTQPAACGSSHSGLVATAAATTTLTINTTAVQAGDIPYVIPNESIGALNGATCASNNFWPRITAVTPGTSFVVTLSGTPTGQECLEFELRH